MVQPLCMKSAEIENLALDLLDIKQALSSSSTQEDDPLFLLWSNSTVSSVLLGSKRECKANTIAKMPQTPLGENTLGPLPLGEEISPGAYFL